MVRVRRKRGKVPKELKDRRDLLVSESKLVFAGLYNSDEEIRVQANLALALAGWDQNEFLAEVERRSA